MKHGVVFENCYNKWDNALPLGNGCFGAMVYYNKHVLHVPMNHYEVYYNISNRVLPKDQKRYHKAAEEPGRIHREYEERAAGNLPGEGELHSSYRVKREESLKKPPVDGNQFSGSYPVTGDLEFYYSDELKNADSKLSLCVEEAKTQMRLEKAGKKLCMETIIARSDCLINRISQSEKGLLKAVKMAVPHFRDRQYPEVTYQQIDGSTFAYTVRYPLSNLQLDSFSFADAAGNEIVNESEFTFSGIVRLQGAKGSLKPEEYGAKILLEDAETEFSVCCGIFTQFRYGDTLAEGIQKMQEYVKNLEQMCLEHEVYWNLFFGQSAIALPDPFLENVYYINQYALDCCSGKDGVMKHQACGLNGLWAVKQPNLWGSMWYWDVNIQAAFAGVFSSNHLELAKVFSDGLLSYTELAEDFARDVHDLDGCAIDYPYHFYYSTWPWCAQYLWFLYEYSLDESYLRNEAYPLFLKLCRFVLGVFHYDAERGYYSVYPDICPEQGPLAHDTGITVSSVKYLLQFTLKAAEILGEQDPILDKCKEVMGKLAPYSLTKDGLYGVCFKDSEEAPDNLWIRHPSMLMPVFPIGEYDITSGEDIRQIISNTIDYLEDRCEIGIFQSSWLAAAAARIGQGQKAIRLLYERGLDHMLRSNGLSAEETDHFVNFCLQSRQPLYYPCMMEFSGEMLVAVNEMLLQSHGGVIRVFPAIPDGSTDYGPGMRQGQSIQQYASVSTQYAAWDTVRFDKLLAKGAFEISAALQNRRLEYIRIYSKKGGAVRVASPFLQADKKVYCDGVEIDAAVYGGVYIFETLPDKTYWIADSPDVPMQEKIQETYEPQILSRMSYTRRLQFVGENPEAQYWKTVDGFLRASYVGNTKIEARPSYKFDFTHAQKDYTYAMSSASVPASENVQRAMGFRTVDEALFTWETGYGFAENHSLELIDRKGPDTLRCDFVQSTQDAEFIIEAPRGQYELLVVSGDEAEESVTVLEAVNGRKCGGEVIPAGRYQCKRIPIVQEEDEPIRLKISTQSGYRWKLNYMILSTVVGY